MIYVICLFKIFILAVYKAVMIGDQRPIWQELISIIATIAWTILPVIQVHRNYRLKKYESAHAVLKATTAIIMYWPQIQALSTPYTV